MTNTALRAAALSAVFLATAASAQQIDLLPEPGMPNPKFQFGTGQVENNKPAVAKEASALPGPTSAWKVGQWHKSEYLSPGQMTNPKPGLYVWETPNKESRLTAQDRGGKWTYQLFSRDGAWMPSGGANVLLSTDASKIVSLDRPVFLSFDGRLFDTSATYDNPAARTNGTVLAQVFAGLWLQFKRPSNGETIPVAMQIEFARSQEQRLNYRSCSIRSNGLPRVVSGRSLPDEVRFPFGRGDAQPQHIRTNVNRYVCDLISQQLQCGKGNASTPMRWDDEARDLRNWTIRSFYIGLETQNRDERKPDAPSPPQGHVAAGLELSGLRLVQDEAGRFSCPTR